ncbi:MAG: glutamine synthetase type III, partial [Anaerolineae bacterium]|nr:glutamine synthetase type III [Anaerolineae bacterium]
TGVQTGNKFEFRAVGSSQSIAGPMMVINTIVAESLDYIANKLEAADDLNIAIQSLLKEVMDENGAVIFNGNGYSEEWHAEAAERGLPNLKTTPDALPCYVTDEATALFEKYGVLTKHELESVYEVALEQYIMTANVEANLTVKIAKTMIFPAAIRYQSELALTCANLKAVGYEFDTNTLDKVTELIKMLQDSIAELETVKAHEDDDALAHAKYVCDTVLPAMLTVRKYADELEAFVADDLWPLPTYQEMLFIK